MTSDFLETLNALHDHHVDFVIVGGVAAALHGGSRVTFDLDVVPSLAPESWQSAVDLLWELGARPRIPEPVERIRDVEHRSAAGGERRACWPSTSARADGGTEVDLLVGESDAFDELKQRAVEVMVDQRTFFVASIDDLISMKQRAGRPQDLLDIAELRTIEERLGQQSKDKTGLTRSQPC